MESLFSFPVGLFHPLQHAGLSRRTPDRRLIRSSNEAPKLDVSGQVEEVTLPELSSAT